MEAAVVERLRRSSHISLHHSLVNAPLIYDQYGREELRKIYQEYVDVAIDAQLPILLLTPTWRANYKRVSESNYPMSINSDSVEFLQEFRQSQSDKKVQIKIGGLIGCKNDCYQPNEALNESESELFHSWQIKQLTLAKVDYLIAETLPNVEEALGIAIEMEKTNIPYMISFVISRDGLVLDGKSLSEAIRYIDNNTTIKPLGYMVNCAYPSFLCAEKQPKELFERLIGYQANASSLDQCDLDGSEQLESDTLSEWGDLMLELNEKYGIKILGGCCGTNGEHLRYISK